MVCTSKEQETCRVEKRGCTGCYYDIGGDYMNEEIIEKIKLKIGNIKDDVKNVEKLLQLYNQEKEKNKELVKVMLKLQK